MIIKDTEGKWANLKNTVLGMGQLISTLQIDMEVMKSRMENIKFLEELIEYVDFIT